MKKIRNVAVILLAILGVMLLANNVYAEGQTMKLNITDARTLTPNESHKYTVLRGTRDYSIFKIGEKSGSAFNFEKALYCLRSGLGFGDSETITNVNSISDATYTKKGNLKTEATEMIKYFTDTDTINFQTIDTNSTKVIDGTTYTFKPYNAILWIADNMYLPKDANSQSMKETLLSNAGIQNSLLTDDDIDVVQQMALWYFSNYDENGTNTSFSLADSVNLGNLLKIDGDNASNNVEDAYNSYRANQINKLYKYFINESIKNSSNYGTESIRPANLGNTTISFADTNPSITRNGNFYIAGPFEVQASNTAITVDSIELKDAKGAIIPEKNNGTSIYTVIKNANDVATFKSSLKDVVGEGSFYIKIETPLVTNYDLSDIALELSYYETEATLWTATREDQPVLLVEKVKKTDSIRTECFDLALRKFITSINRTELTGDSSRIPQIDLSKLNTYDNLTGQEITTATYTHPKTPIVVKKGDKVVYTIRIYNEGKIDGKALEITDYLPEGLQFVTDSDINRQYGWVVSADGKEITTDYLKDTTIKAYDPSITTNDENIWQKVATGESGLYYADVKIECEVISSVGSSDKFLRNIAEISADSGDDRDSTPDDVNKNNYNPPANNSTYQEDDDDYEDLVLPGVSFDLSLRKFITALNNEQITNRIPQIDLSRLNRSGVTTATYKHPKDAVAVQRGDKVVYTIRVYNEGQIAGNVLELTDYLPEGLKFVTDSQINREYGWRVSVDGKQIITDYLKDTTIKAYDPSITTDDASIWQKGTTGEGGLYYADVKIECEVISSVGASDKFLRNIAEITADKAIDENNNEIVIDDRDSTPDNVDINNYNPPADNSTYQQDDDDYEDLVLPGVTFDLALRKFITKVNGETLQETRTPVIDLTKLNKLTGTSRTTTATYTHPKTPVVVRKGDIVTYKIRIYNESEIDGYATKIADYLPEGLGLLLDYKTNTDNYWKVDTNNIENLVKTIPLVGEQGLYKDVNSVKHLKLEDFYQKESLKDVNILTGNVEIYTEALKEEIIKAYNEELTSADIASTDLWQKGRNTESGLYYREVEVACIVLADNIYQDEPIKNIAEIKADKAVDEDGNEIVIDDRDSTPNNVDINNYNPPADNSTYQQDDDDYEPLILKYFDLALRKFITGVNDEQITTRVPQITFDENGEIVYRHDKTPVNVSNGDLITYTIRVFNEGTVAGYAEEIRDDIPAGLIFLPDNDVNKQYGWKMYYYDEDGSLVETEDTSKATFIKTTYLSSEDASNILREFNKNEMNEPDYKDVKVVFKLEEKQIPAENTTRIVTNKADISKDSDDDIDSTPNKWIEDEDDQDEEHVYVRCFDLSLLKWVTKTIVTVDNKTTTTETGFMPNQGYTDQTGEGIRANDTNEPIAKVEIDKKKIKSTSVKFVYNIKVTNEGDIDGQATEITDYIPEGLEFYVEDNAGYGWEKTADNKITTRILDGITLKAPVKDENGDIVVPGDSKTLEVVFRWKNDLDNIGIKTNIAEITEDYNDKNSEDIDSVPDTINPSGYEKEQEDDDDFALVVLSIKTGNESSYIGLALVVLMILTGGIILIKKYAL